MRRVLVWAAVAAGSAGVGWVVCYVTALLVFQRFQVADLDVPLEDIDE